MNADTASSQKTVEGIFGLILFPNVCSEIGLWAQAHSINAELVEEIALLKTENEQLRQRY